MIRNIIYGDFKYKNEQVEVFLHQRTSKKVKYKKREYAEIHPISVEMLNEIKNDLINAKYSTLFDVRKDIEQLRTIFNIKTI